jgi:putative endonuclease
MAAHHEFGKAGELMAAEWLKIQGFHLIYRNWKYGRYEIDIIASKGDTLHIIEVKSRKDTRFGNPEDWVDRNKWNHMAAAGEGFQYQHPSWMILQFDILAILLTSDNRAEFFFIEDVYWW